MGDDLENESNVSSPENDTLIKASTKRDVTLRFIKSIEEEQEHRKNNPALREALEACSVDDQVEEVSVRERSKETVKIMDIPSSNTNTSLIVSINSEDSNSNE